MVSLDIAKRAKLQFKQRFWDSFSGENGLINQIGVSTPNLVGSKQEHPDAGRPEGEFCLFVGLSRIPESWEELPTQLEEAPIVYQVLGNLEAV